MTELKYTKVDNEINDIEELNDVLGTPSIEMSDLTSKE